MRGEAHLEARGDRTLHRDHQEASERAGSVRASSTVARTGTVRLPALDLHAEAPRAAGLGSTRLVYPLMAPRSYREWLRLNNRENTPGELEAYLAEDARTEGWTSEFKAAAKDADYTVREAVAALANVRGGEVFVGVDDDGKVRAGSGVTQEALNETLRQGKATPAAWRVTDLLLLTGNTTEVPLPGGKSRVYVLEVRPYDLPAFVLDKTGGLALPIRSGSDTKLLDASSAIEWHRLRRRADVLRGCHRELVTFVLQLSQHRALADALPDRLPYIQSIIEDGTTYYVLEASDRAALFGAGTGNGRTGGAVDTYYRALRRIRAALDRLQGSYANVAIRDLPTLQSEFSNLEGEASASVTSFATYVRSQGFTVD